MATKRKRAARRERPARRERLDEAMPRAALVAVAREAAARYLGVDGVVGVGIALRRIAGELTSQVALQFVVDRKMTRAQLRSSARQQLPAALALLGVDIDTDVVEDGIHLQYELVAEQREALSRRWAHTLRPGISISGKRGRTGTLGAIVYDQDSDQPLLLSNWHVLDAGASPGSAIFQPGRRDDSSNAQTRCGKLLRSHLGLAGDCAVALLEGRSWLPATYETEAVPSRIASPEIGDVLIKVGRTTGKTYGKVVSAASTRYVPYPVIGRQAIGGLFEIAPLAATARTAPICADGDSGSLWFVADANGEATDIAVGLHVAGDTRGDVVSAIAGEIRPMLRKLRCTFGRPT